VGCPQISSAIRKYSNLRTYISLNFQTFRKCGNSRICGLRIIYFCDLQIWNFWTVSGPVPAIFPLDHDDF
jgi:hypothetical protein